MPNETLRRAGSMVNQYLGDVGTATAPGAGSDLMGYLMNELTKYPGTTDRDPKAPVFDVINNVITNLLSATGLNNPIEQASGPAQAILGPIGRVTAEAVGSPGAAKAVNQAQKKIIKALFRGDPETLKDVAASPRMMHVGVPGAGSDLPKSQSMQMVDELMEGAFAHYQPGGLAGTVRVHPSTMKGINPVFGKPLKAEGVEGLPDIVTHEATHFLNDPLFSSMVQSGDKTSRSEYKLAAALRPFIQHAKYGPGIVGKHAIHGATPRAVDEGLSYLSQPTGRSPAAGWLHNVFTTRPNAEGIGQFDEVTQGLLQDVLSAAIKIPGIRRTR